jgi:diguanylate cyclase (GGDEF)-like protein
LKTGLFISLLNPAIAIIVACAFLLLWLYQRQRRHLAVLAVGYTASAIGFLLQYFTLPVGLPLSRLISAISFAVAMSCVVGAVLASRDRKVPYAVMGLLSAAGIAAFCWFMFVVPDLVGRIYALNFAFGGITLVAAIGLGRIRQKAPLDRILLALSLLSTLNLLVRPVLIISLQGGYATYEGLYDSLYWTTAVFSHAIVSLLLAFTLFAAAALDVMRELRAETNADSLSGLLNRRGFERAATGALSQHASEGLPAAIVITDLDHFKAVNDVFGHAVGDRVIIAFAELLRSAATGNGIAGRLGGEEFAVLLPATDLAAARLFAEGVRMAFSNVALRNVPEQVLVTASFGVASLSGTESLSDLLGRADAALYSAKKAGRDRVRLSYQYAAEQKPGAAMAERRRHRSG